MFPDQIIESPEPNCSIATWDILPKNVSSKSFSVLCINMRSMCNKFEEFEGLIKDSNLKFTFIVITESWLKKDIDILYELDGYRSKSIYRDMKRGGGIKLYYRDHLNVKLIIEYTHVKDYCKMLTIECLVSGLGKIFISCVYRPPNNMNNEFFENISNLLSYVQNRNAIVLGDFNFDMNTTMLDDNIRQYIGIFNEHGFFHEISLNTYISPSNGDVKSCIDQIWTNLDFNRESFVINPPLSDHCAISTFFKITLDLPPVLTKFRDFQNSNVVKYKEYIQMNFLLLLRNVIYHIELVPWSYG